MSEKDKKLAEYLCRYMGGKLEETPQGDLLCHVKVLNRDTGKEETVTVKFRRRGET